MKEINWDAWLLWIQRHIEVKEQRMKWPWAKRQHYHADPGFLKYVTCTKCRHLILAGHVTNKRVQVIDRSGGSTITRNEIYGLSCIPDYDLKEIGIDGHIRFYQDGVEVMK